VGAPAADAEQPVAAAEAVHEPPRHHSPRCGQLIPIDTTCSTTPSAHSKPLLPFGKRFENLLYPLILIMSMISTNKCNVLQQKVRIPPFVRKHTFNFFVAAALQ
jgi:hypothetical protein